jgi:hypothetical protein
MSCVYGGTDFKSDLPSRSQVYESLNVVYRFANLRFFSFTVSAAAFTLPWRRTGITAENQRESTLYRTQHVGL